MSGLSQPQSQVPFDLSKDPMICAWQVTVLSGKVKMSSPSAWLRSHRVALPNPQPAWCAAVLACRSFFALSRRALKLASGFPPQPKSASSEPIIKILRILGYCRTLSAARPGHWRPPGRKTISRRWLPRLGWAVFPSWPNRKDHLPKSLAKEEGKHAHPTGNETDDAPISVKITDHMEHSQRAEHAQGRACKNEMMRVAIVITPNLIIQTNRLYIKL